jgi:hypothetical protein
MFVLVSAALAVLAGYGVAWLSERGALGWRRTTISAMLIAAALLESTSIPLNLRAYPRKMPPMYQFLKQQPSGVVMEWPLPRPSSLGVTLEPLYMYFSIFHWFPLVNGYSGAFPRSYLQFIDTVSTFPSRKAVEAMRSVSVRYVILHGAFEPKYTMLRLELSDRRDFTFMGAASDGFGDATMYELR